MIKTCVQALTATSQLIKLKRHYLDDLLNKSYNKSYSKLYIITMSRCFLQIFEFLRICCKQLFLQHVV